MSEAHTLGPISPERLDYATALANDLDARGEIVSAQLVRDLVSHAAVASAWITKAKKAMGRSSPWLAKLIAEGVHERCSSPSGAIKALDTVNELLETTPERTPAQ